MKRLLTLFFLLALPSLLSACATVAGAGATAGVAASQERGLGVAIDDSATHAKIWRLWLDTDPHIFLEVGVDVHEGRVLLTGTINSPQNRLDAVRLAWQVEGVRQVIDEIQVTDEGGVLDYSRDVWITAQLRSKITFDSEILAINYSIETVNKVVYLMGVAQSEAEIDRVIRYARNIDYVRKVVSHVRIKAERLPGT
ncbi:MAG: BON domain-containing protein [Alphaproteobacteria bacterium]|nr:BON domain-containing protein [Alphaproteobacteria bacterium]